MKTKVTLERAEIETAVREWLKTKGVIADKLEFSYHDHTGTRKVVGPLEAITEGPHEKLIPAGPYR